MASFRNHIAMRYGVQAALIMQHLWDEAQKGEKAGCKSSEGVYWYLFPQRMFCLHFPYLSRSMVRRTLKSLMKEHIIRKKELGECPFDHSAWYSFTDLGKKLMEEGETEK